MGFDELEAVLGRKLPVHSFYPDPDMTDYAAAIQLAYGLDEPDINGQPESYVDKQRTPENIAAVADLMGSL